MAKTLKFALSALALVNGQKPRDDVQHAYDQFLKDFGKTYDSVEKQVGLPEIRLRSVVLIEIVQTNFIFSVYLVSFSSL